MHYKILKGSIYFYKGGKERKEVRKGIRKRSHPSYHNLLNLLQKSLYICHHLMCSTK